jgi:Flp pilus assembly protein TadB
MAQVRFIQMGGRLGPLGWLVLILTIAAALALVAAVTVVAFSVFMIVAPVLIVLALGFNLYRLLLRRRRRAQGPDIIDGEYRVIDSGSSYRSRDDGFRRH